MILHVTHEGEVVFDGTIVQLPILYIACLPVYFPSFIYYGNAFSFSPPKRLFSVMAKMPSGRRICILICSCFIFTTVWNVTNAFVNLLLDQLAYGREKFHSIIGQVKIFFLLQSQYFLFIFLHAAKLSTEWPNRHCKIFQNSCEIFHFYVMKNDPTLQILTFDPSLRPINKGKFSDRFFPTPQNGSKRLFTLFLTRQHHFFLRSSSPCFGVTPCLFPLPGMNFCSASI